MNVEVTQLSIHFDKGNFILIFSPSLWFHKQMSTISSRSFTSDRQLPLFHICHFNIIVAQNTLKLFSNSELLLFQLGRKSRFPPKKSFITQTPKHGYYFGYIILSQRLPMISIFYTNHINFDRSCHVWDETCRIILLKIIDIILKTSSRYLNPGIARKFTDLFIPIFGNLP